MYCLSPSHMTKHKPYLFFVDFQIGGSHQVLSIMGLSNVLEDVLK